LVERLPDLRPAGFYTQELRGPAVRVPRGRVGFEAVGLSSGQRALLAHTRSRSRHRVGRYGVEVTALAQLVGVELVHPAADAGLIGLDEIGKMELLCGEFVDAVRRLLDGPVPVVATVAARGGGLITEAKAREGVRLVQVTPENRDTLPAELEAWVRDRVRPAKPAG